MAGERPTFDLDAEEAALQEQLEALQAEEQHLTEQMNRAQAEFDRVMTGSRRRRTAIQGRIARARAQLTRDFGYEFPETAEPAEPAAETERPGARVRVTPEEPRPARVRVVPEEPARPTAEAEEVEAAARVATERVKDTTRVLWNWLKTH